MALLLPRGRSAKNHPLVHEDIIPNLSCLSDDHSSTVVNKELPADFGSGVDFNTGQETANLGKEASQKAELVPPEKMSRAMKPQGMQSWIAEDDLQHTSRCRVFSKNRLNVFPNGLKHNHLFS
jgi:hypothetical protein